MSKNFIKIWSQRTINCAIGSLLVMAFPSSPVLANAKREARTSLEINAEIAVESGSFNEIVSFLSNNSNGKFLRVDSPYARTPLGKSREVWFVLDEQMPRSPLKVRLSDASDGVIGVQIDIQLADNTIQSNTLLRPGSESQMGKRDMDSS